MLQRRDFLYTLGASGLAPALIGAAGSPPEPARTWLERALVLSGGGARGAYEAGIVGAIAAGAAVDDGTPLPGYDLVCGTSIGALNGWFVATGQYRRLKDLWYGISGQALIQAKREYAALHDPDSGLFNRAASALRLMGLVKNETALLETQSIFSWISRHIDPATPLLVPLVWAITNLSTQRPEYFYLRPPSAAADLPQRVVHALQLSLGPHTVVRECTPELLHRAIFASAAIPLAFDPVEMPGPDGTANQYCDGGVASNSPVGIAHAVANAADVVLLDPKFEDRDNYADAIDVGLAAYGTMQRKILDVELRNAYFQSVTKTAFSHLRQFARGARPSDVALIQRFMNSMTATNVRYIRPDHTLPVGVGGFGDEVGIGKAYRIGWLDAARGFTEYDWETFEL
jgi:predicted acylesterase/phospholipase RssA